VASSPRPFRRARPTTKEIDRQKEMIVKKKSSAWKKMSRNCATSPATPDADAKSNASASKFQNCAANFKHHLGPWQRAQDRASTSSVLTHWILLVCCSRILWNWHGDRGYADDKRSSRGLGKCHGRPVGHHRTTKKGATRKQRLVRNLVSRTGSYRKALRIMRLPQSLGGQFLPLSIRRGIPGN